MTSIYPKDPPSDWLIPRIFLTDLKSLNISDYDIESYNEYIKSAPFIIDHVGGSGISSPQRGVLVIGNTSGDYTMEESFWTSSQNTSNITLVSKTVEYPEEVSCLIPSLKSYMNECFSSSPISDSTFSLAVANHYMVGYKHKICAHTDAQPWYASPPVFASITTFPNGIPKDYRSTFRFQVLDEGYTPPKFIDLFLDQDSVCMMRADVTHRVLPPLKSQKKHYPRINITFRNLVPLKQDPLGYVLAVSNHYRYYGIPKKLILPQDVDIPIDLYNRYKKLNPDLIVSRYKKNNEKIKNKKKKLRIKLKKFYKEKGLMYNEKMASKTNVVMEALKLAIKLCNNIG